MAIIEFLRIMHRPVPAGTVRLTAHACAFGRTGARRKEVGEDEVAEAAAGQGVAWRFWRLLATRRDSGFAGQPPASLTPPLQRGVRVPGAVPAVLTAFRAPCQTVETVAAP